jgi:hypothetical protein
LNPRKIVAAAGIAGALIFTSACSAPEATSAAGTPGASEAAPAAVTPSATPSPTSKFPYTLPSGLVAKGVANDGRGEYLQTGIADTDPAMQYNAGITDDAAKAHFSEADLAEAQKVVVRFIAEEGIDSTLNGGGNPDLWLAAHKDQIHSSFQDILLTELKDGKDVFARESWMATKPGLSYVHGADAPRVTMRVITPQKLRFIDGNGLQGVFLDTTAAYSMAVTADGARKPDQNSTAEISYAVAKDAADGKWKIAAYQTNFRTAEHLD